MVVALENLYSDNSAGECRSVRGKGAKEEGERASERDPALAPILAQQHNRDYSLLKTFLSTPQYHQSSFTILLGTRNYVCSFIYYSEV